MKLWNVLQIIKYDLICNFAICQPALRKKYPYNYSLLIYLFAFHRTNIEQYIYMKNHISYIIIIAIIIIIQLIAFRVCCTSIMIRKGCHFRQLQKLLPQTRTVAAVSVFRTHRITHSHFCCAIMEQIFTKCKRTTIKYKNYLFE